MLQPVDNSTLQCLVLNTNQLLSALFFILIVYFLSSSNHLFLVNTIVIGFICQLQFSYSKVAIMVSVAAFKLSLVDAPSTSVLYPVVYVFIYLLNVALHKYTDAVLTTTIWRHSQQQNAN